MSKEKENVIYGWVIEHNSYRKKNEEKKNSPIDFYYKFGIKTLEKIILVL